MLALTSLSFVIAVAAAPPPGALVPKAAVTPRVPQPGSPAARLFGRLVRDARQALDENRLDDAVLLLRDGLKRRPAWAEGWWLLGATLYDLKRYSEAREAFGRLVGVSPTHGPGWAFQGLCGFQVGDYGRARADLLHGLRLGLGDSREIVRTVRYNLAILATRLEDFESASEILAGFVRQGDDSLDVVEALGLALLRLPFLPSEAPADKRELILMAGRVAVSCTTRPDAVARAAFEELVQRYPTTPNVHYAYGLYLLPLDSNAALEAFRRELRLSPTHIHARVQIAFELIGRGDYEGALPMAREAAELAPAYAVARLALGRIYLKTDAVAQAVAELEAGVKLMPASPTLRITLRQAYLKAGRLQDAGRQQSEIQRLEREGASAGLPAVVGLRPGESATAGPPRP